MMRALLLWLVLALPGWAAGGEQIVAGLSQNRVSITANFDGSEILIYGAVKREAPAPTTGPLQVIVTVEGPSTALTIRRKERRAGIWVNTEKVRIDSAPSFYVVASTGPLADILSDTDDLRHQITLPRMIRAVGITGEAPDAPDFVTALLRIRQGEDRYRIAEGAVQLTDDTLFRADVALPANLVEGDYRVRIFLVREGRVIDGQERVIDVRKEGLERFLFTMAHEQPLAYGLAALLIALVAGWGASAAFRFLRV